MLDKLNQIASMVSDLISGQGDGAKKKKYSQKGPEQLDGDKEDQLDPNEDANETAAARAQKSIRKSTGGLKEPK